MSASQKRQRAKKGKNKKNLLIVIVAIIVITLAIVVINKIKILSYNNVYEGVYIGETHVGGMTENELFSKIPELINISDTDNIKINISDTSETLSISSLSPSLNVEQMVQNAMSFGRTSTGLLRLSEISNIKKNHVSVPITLFLDEYELQKSLDKLSANLDISAVDNKIEISENSLIITRGNPGRGIVYEEIKSEITDAILNHKNEINLQLKYIEPEEITVDFIKRHTSSVPTEATYTIVDHKLYFTQSSPGVKFDEKEVKRILGEEKDSNVIVVPAEIINPSVSTESLKSSIVADELSTYSSDFSSSSNDRAHNIQLACSKIDGYILAPGEEFSYNDVVGPRTQERGFRMANVYVGNTVQSGIGGGICQVSSTMFNAVVFADLEVTARRNHTLPVSYVPMGRDATVSYGSVDFKFKNTYDKPIEIRAKCIGRKNIISIYGTAVNTNRKIEILTEKTGTSSPNVVQKQDPTLPEGTIKVESPGTNGSSYIAYKVVYENGVKVSNDILCKSTYKGKDRIEIIGTQKVEPSPTPEAKPITTDKPSSQEENNSPSPTSAPSTASNAEPENETELTD